MVTPEQPVTKLEPTRSARMPPQLLPPRRPRQQKHKLLIVRAMLRRHALKLRGCADALLRHETKRRPVHRLLYQPAINLQAVLVALLHLQVRIVAAMALLRMVCPWARWQL